MEKKKRKERKRSKSTGKFIKDDKKPTECVNLLVHKEEPEHTFTHHIKDEMKSSGKKLIIFLFILFCLALVGVISIFFMGVDNGIEKGVEVIIEAVIEKQLNLKPGSFPIDLSPNSN